MYTPGIVFKTGEISVLLLRCIMVADNFPMDAGAFKRLSFTWYWLITISCKLFIADILSVCCEKTAKGTDTKSIIIICFTDKIIRKILQPKLQDLVK